MRHKQLEIVGPVIGDRIWFRKKNENKKKIDSYRCRLSVGNPVWRNGDTARGTFTQLLGLS